MSYLQKYIKYKTKYFHLQSSFPLEGGSELQIPSIFIDVYKFKLMNYNKSNYLQFGNISQTNNINNGLINVIDKNDDITSSSEIDSSYYSIDYIQSNRISNKYYTLYNTYPAKNTKPYKYNEKFTIELKANIMSASSKLYKTNVSNDTGYVKKIFITNREKIIVFGDFHGSFHTFFRHILRLHIMGVLNLNTYKINDGYRLVFLGDIIDRGGYSLEILNILFMLIINNDIDKIIINRGNHEETIASTKYGFREEVLRKTSNEKIYSDILLFFSYCSSAIVLVNRDTGKKYWLCHGLIYDDRMLYDFINNDETTFSLDKNGAFKIRWTDTPRININTGMLNKQENGYDSRHSIGTDVMNKYLTQLDFIIRGHEDSTSNAWLLHSRKHNVNMGEDYLDEQTHKFNIHKNKMKQLMRDTNIIAVNNNNQIDGPVQTITNLELIDFYNVLTISTNTDLLRNLISDSFIVMRFNDISLPLVSECIKEGINVDNDIGQWLSTNDEYLII